MNKLTIDFETRSQVDLKKTGAWKYAQSETTDIICLAMKMNDEPTGLWINSDIVEYKEYPSLSERDVYDLVNRADIVEAHNAQFEIAIWKHICSERFGWPEIQLEQWRCSMAKALALSLPASLDKLAKALRLKVKKDLVGHRIMLKMCKPRKPRKAERESNPDWEKTVYWYEDLHDFQTLFRYCIQDVETEHAISESLRDLSRPEQRLWFLDQQINERGIYIDIEGVESALYLIDEIKEEIKAKTKIVSNGVLDSPTQVQKTLDFLSDNGLNLLNLQKGTISESLNSDIPDICRKILKLRRAISMTSTSKYNAYINRASKDNRAKGLMQYHGASTGRWAGRGIQPQNLPRGKFKDTDTAIKVIKERDLDYFKAMYDPMSALSTCVRGMICAAPGNELLAVDYSAIEGRVLAWLANEQYVLDNYSNNMDPYIVFASKVHPKYTYDEILIGYKNHDIKFEEIRGEGKVGELACGYQGGYRAVAAFAPNMPEEKQKQIVEIWRGSRPLTKQYWYDLENCAIEAVKTGKRITLRNVTWGTDIYKGQKYLLCRLPSGRLISYFNPVLKFKEMPWGKQKQVLTYMTTDVTGKYVRTSTYGGKLAENIVQAASRCLLSDALMRVNDAGLKIVLHVHDEIVIEAGKGEISLKYFEDLVSTKPDWAFDLPLKAEGWKGKRYRK